ncbi:MAG: hypothetical protein A2086_08355 [Spirochaetes bacterium GWD1_27_9]|nr:MAG: hypothetical protein A2Z98_05000 [Spirochaetes bacterium GWB1_27_13]OHD25829.1 MAG: hypothetical protein A2Y34_16325 [Spirochaetes bacterium GWC1_27_15]OHD42139.1 MAG: hypothetical protein A2086_08355 [Spirochaetes bacterium GWD1_27_9]
MEKNDILLLSALKIDKKFNILVVDDDEIVITTLKEIIAKVNNFSVIGVTTPDKAIDIVKHQKIDLLVVDYFLPYMNGIELIKTIQKIDNEIPCIMISGKIASNILIEALNSNLIFRFIPKPWKNKHLLNSIYEALELKILKETAKEYKEQLEKQNFVLEDSYSRLESILMNISDAILVLFPDGKINLINKRMEHLLFGRDNSCYSLFSIYDLKNINALTGKIASFITGDKESDKFEEKLFDKCYFVYISKFRNNDEKLLGIVLTFVDVTKEKDLDKLKSDFVANVSHEFKTPLSSIQGFSEVLLRNHNLSKDKEKEYLNIIFKESLRLKGLVNSILNLSRFETSYEDLNLEKFNIVSIIEDCIFLLTKKIEEKEINLIFKTNKKYIIFSNKEMVKEIFINLIENAIKYTPKNGIIVVTLFYENEQLLVSIKDNGSGIPKEEHENIFKKFYRLKNSNENENGYGLGLSIVKAILNILKIPIKLNSSLGEGSEFILIFDKEKIVNDGE